MLTTTFKQVKNNAKSVSVSGALNNTTSPLTFGVAVGTGSRFPATANGPFYVTAWNKGLYPNPSDDPNMRIGLCTERSGDNLTVAWGQLATPIEAVSGMLAVEVLILDQHFADIQKALNDLEGGSAVVVSNTGGDFTVAKNVDASASFASAIASLTPSRTSVEVVYLKGDFLVDAHTVVPSNTIVFYDGTIRVSDGTSAHTLRPTGATNWANNMGVFELGDRTSKPVTRNAWVIGLPGSRIIGDYFNVDAVSYPQDKVNSPAAGFTDSTLLNTKDVCGVHSYCTLIDSGAMGINVENMHGSIRYETMGRTNGTPSKALVARGSGRYTIIGIEVYSNGYQADSTIVSYHGENCIDDMVAIVGSDGGVSGAPGITQGVTVESVTGNKNGLRGAALKIDGGGMLSGLGQVRDITVGMINVKTTSPSMSGVTPNENVTYNILMGNVASRNISYGQLRGSGSWRFGIRTDTAGVGLSIKNVYVEAYHGCILKSPIVPNDLQKVEVEGEFVQRNGVSGESGSRGVAIMGGATAQGFKNLRIRAKAQYFEKPFVERGIVGLGADGTIQNVDYEIDVMDKATSDVDLISTNRRVVTRKHGALQQAIYLLPFRTPASATATGSAGEIVWDANYVYFCVADNTWRRAAHSTW